MAASIVLPDGKELQLRNRLTIGRADRNALTIDEATVSRNHAVVQLADGRWHIEDRGSSNGTFVNDVRVPPRVPHRLRHCDRIKLGAVELVFSHEQHADPNDTAAIEGVPLADVAALSAFQLQVVRCLCSRWLDGHGLDAMPSNRDIAEELGTPEAEGAVKAALRRAYAKAGLTGLEPQAKRRQLCRVARQRGWV